MNIPALKQQIDELITTNANLKAVDFNPLLKRLIDTVSRRIPKLIIESKSEEVYVKLPPFEDQTWLSMNPRVFVFHKKNAKKHKKRNNVDESISAFYFAGYHHPSHLNGINWENSSFFSGSTSFPYHTEFPLLITNDYHRQQLGEFDPKEFLYHLSIDNEKTQPWPALMPATELDRMRAVGRKVPKGSKSNYFRFCIAIDNPDETAKCPVLFGELSEAIQVLPHMTRVEEVNTVFFKILHETNAIKRTQP